MPNRTPGPDTKDRELPCGCILCICEDDEKCHGCGAKSCGKPDCVRYDYVSIKRKTFDALVGALRMLFEDWVTLTEQDYNEGCEDVRNIQKTVQSALREAGEEA